VCKLTEEKSMSDRNATAAPDVAYRPLTNAVQIAYVTNDIDRAGKMFRTIYGIENWLDLAAMSGRQTVSIQARQGRIEIRGMIAYVGAVQFELIQPIVDPERLYTDFLPADGAFAIRFHHLGFNQGGVEAVRALESRLGRDHLIPMATDSQAMPVFYADARDRLGHYLEYFSLPVAFDALIPRN
jgi:Glyoxalase/Bleomycin resistance protein/Dioxygenase superfamily